jgi:hypothetical protein
VGPLIRLLLISLWGLHGDAYAKATVVAVLSAGPAVPGEIVQVDIGTLEDGVGQGGVEPTLEIEGGTIDGAIHEFSEGRWRVRVRIGEKPVKIRASYNGVSTQLTIKPEAFGESAVVAPKRVDGRTRRKVTFGVNRRDGSALPVEYLTVSASEGGAKTMANEDGTVAVEWTPGRLRYPRVVTLLLQDDSRPTAPPFVMAVHLSAQPTIPIRTEPGAKVTLRQGTQVLGPKIADSSGLAEFKVDVFPGVHAVAVDLEDQLGNRQTKDIAIGGLSGPWTSMVQMGSMIAGGAPPNVYIAGIDELGSPWTKSPPDCGEGISVVQLGPGLWRYHPSRRAIALGIDHRIDCSVGGGPIATLIVPVNRSRATRLVLQSYPDQLSADIPIAELQAYLLNGLGERLPSNGIQIDGDLGVIQRDRVEAPTLVRARYDGTLAAPRQEDLIRATWNHPAGSGGLWDLAVRGAAPGDAAELLVDVRAVDQGGRPLAGESIEIEILNEKNTLKTDVRGWATVTSAWPKGASYVIVSARNRRIVRRSVVFRGDRVEATEGRPDLMTEVLLPILPGRVHGVYLSTQPRTLTNDGMTGKIEARLEDKLGNPVTGQPVQLTASYGVIGPVTLLPNGSFVANFAPPVGMTPGTTRITATTEDGLFSASTDVEVVHRVVNWSAGAQLGYIVGGSELSSPWVETDVDVLLPFASVYVRGSIGVFRPSAKATDPVTGGAVEMDMSVAPIGLGVLARRSPARVPTWFGGQVVMAPYRLVARVSDVTAIEGSGWMSPGATVFGGVGFRLGGGEVYGQVKYLFLSAPESTIGWEGSVGGVVGALGYKLLY